MFNFEDHENSLVLEVEGVWKEFPGGCAIKIARWGNPDYDKALRALATKDRALLANNDDVSHARMLEITIKIMANTIIKDTRGFAIGGVEVKYTPEIGMKILKDRNFREKVRAYAEEEANYLKKNEEEEIAKSKSFADGGSPTAQS